MLFDGWDGPLRVLIVGVMAYTALVLLLRSSGKRTLTKLNAFDLVVTVALGSTLATILLSRQTPLVDGVVALGLLILLQLVITWLSVRISAVRSLVRSEPRLLFHRGEFLDRTMRDERISREEILQAMRSSGQADPERVEAVVLETDGSMSIVPRSDSAAATLADVS